MELLRQSAPALNPAMAEPISETLQKKLSERLSFYEDLGIQLFYRDRAAAFAPDSDRGLQQPSITHFSSPGVQKEQTLPKPAAKPAFQKNTPAATPVIPKIPSLPVVAGPSLFEAADKIADDTLLKVREDLGECTRCKLHSTRHTIVFGDGNPKAEMVFVGEGPGADEDAQGLPFVGRAGKLLTQMIEAMGLQRKDVYICNVVKCRPPGNRQPEEDEVSTCSPFLFRQIDVIAPKVIVCLGAVAAKTLLQTNRGISQFRGEWLEFRGRKLLATYHPAYLLRNPPAKSEVWKDLQKVMAVLGLEVKKGKSS
jgi:uracil-DNA glycosylase family 4